MITIRLSRVGRKNDPSFRVIVVESKRKPQPGNYLENVGSYDPRTDRIELKSDRIKHWIQNGATVSETVHNLLVSQKVIDAKKINVLPKKTVTKPASTEASGKDEEVTPAAETPTAEAVSEAAVEEKTEEPVSSEAAPE